MAISLPMLYHKTKVVIFIYRIPLRMRIRWHVAGDHIDFYQDPVGNFIEVCSEGSSEPAPAACSCSLWWGGCRRKPGQRNPDHVEGILSVMFPLKFGGCREWKFMVNCAYSLRNWCSVKAPGACVLCACGVCQALGFLCSMAEGKIKTWWVLKGEGQRVQRVSAQTMRRDPSKTKGVSVVCVSSGHFLITVLKKEVG